MLGWVSLLANLASPELGTAQPKSVYLIPEYGENPLLSEYIMKLIFYKKNSCRTTKEIVGIYKTII